MAREKYFYDILSVSSDASVEEIARSYKKMALKCHPDKTNHNPQLTEKFKEATRAYEVLKDDNKRKIYDAYGEAGLDGTEDVSQPAKRPPYSATSTSSTSSSNIHVHSAHNVFSQVFSDINSIFGNDPTSSSTSFFSQFPMNMDMNMNMNMNMNTQGMKKSVQPAPADPRADRPIRAVAKNAVVMGVSIQNCVMFVLDPEESLLLCLISIEIKAISKVKFEVKKRQMISELEKKHEKAKHQSQEEAESSPTPEDLSEDIKDIELKAGDEHSIKSNDTTLIRKNENNDEAIVDSDNYSEDGSIFLSESPVKTQMLKLMIYHWKAMKPILR
ncbi:hypothetical protein QCA50_012288 [Cerrena zonata]|uniref:J domain-containing protein n=1 Tax=Cerrena zonata TaxID=2478898 RepID=A0AAW0FTQ5_9APHY